MKELFKVLGIALQVAQDANAKHYNKRWKNKTFAVGDQVWLHTLDVQTQRPNQKLSQKKIGLFTITKVINQNVYKLNLLTYFCIWPIFNINCLESYIPLLPSQVPLWTPDPEIIDGKPEWKVDTIVNIKKQKGTYLYKVHWIGLLHEDNTWKPAYHLRHTKKAVLEFYIRP